MRDGACEHGLVDLPGSAERARKRVAARAPSTRATTTKEGRELPERRRCSPSRAVYPPDGYNPDAMTFRNPIRG
jgi:hypothetical protein